MNYEELKMTTLHRNISNLRELFGENYPVRFGQVVDKRQIILESE